MSSWMGVSCPPAPLPPAPDSVRRASPAAWLRAPARTAQPTRVKCSAVALPMPVEAPVMRAVGTSSGYSELTALGRQRLQQLAEGIGELLHALALKRLSHVVVVDAHGCQLLDQALRVRESVFQAHPRATVVLIGPDRLLGHGVDRVWRHY